ncbi:hypothetical protein [Streptomyces sp. TE5632]
MSSRPGTVGRFTLARLTDEGWHKVAAAAPEHVDAVRRYVFDTLTPEQRRALGEAAARIVEVLDPPGFARA